MDKKEIKGFDQYEVQYYLRNRNYVDKYGQTHENNFSVFDAEGNNYSGIFSKYHNAVLQGDSLKEVGIDGDTFTAGEVAYRNANKEDADNGEAEAEADAE